MKPLLDRRTFLKDAGALTVSAGLIVSSAAAITPAATSQGPRIGAVLFDSRYSSCREFASVLVREGAAAFDTREDVAALWYGPLRTHLAKYGGCVAGLTTHSDFVVSQSFGVELRLALRYEGLHDSRASRTLAHQFRTRGNAADIEAALRGSTSDWAQSLGCALSRIVSAESAGPCELSVMHTPRLDDHPGFLRSWFLAPVPKTALA